MGSNQFLKDAVKIARLVHSSKFRRVGGYHNFSDGRIQPRMKDSHALNSRCVFFSGWLFTLTKTVFVWRLLLVIIFHFVHCLRRGSGWGYTTVVGSYTILQHSLGLLYSCLYLVMQHMLRNGVM